MKKIHLMQLGVFILLLILTTCTTKDEKEENEVLTAVKRVQIGDSIIVDFPLGSIKPGKVILDKITNQNIEYIFDETKDLFKVDTKLDFQIQLKIGNQPPQNDSIKITITLPTAFRNSTPSNYGFELFALVYQDGGMEILDLFDLLPSKFDAASGKLSATLPRWIFSNKRNADQSYETILIVATTPGANLFRTLQKQTTTSECFSQISCPIGSLATCNEKAGDGFGTRPDPVTGNPQKHWGIDYKVPVGTSIYAAASGTIEKIRTQKDINGNIIGYGLYITIRHDDGSATLYGHLSQSNVQVGQKVKGDEEIAKSGNAGKSTGPHLHFEYVSNGQIVLSKLRQDPTACITEGNSDGSITVRDNGNWADDAFELFLDGIFVGRTEIGASNSVALSHLRPGTKSLKLVCTVAPDNDGTYEVALNDGLKFSDGGYIKSGVIRPNQSVTWSIIIPNVAGRFSNNHQMRPNAYIEH